MWFKSVKDRFSLVGLGLVCFWLGLVSFRCVWLGCVGFGFVSLCFGWVGFSLVKFGFVSLCLVGSGLVGFRWVSFRFVVFDWVRFGLVGFGFISLCLVGVGFDLVGFGFVSFRWLLWQYNHCMLSNAKSSLYIHVKYIGFGLVGFYGISTIVMPNLVYTYILNI